MSCCCTRVLNLCNVPVCGLLEIEQIIGSGESGEYSLKLDYFQTQIVITTEQGSGENITFDVSSLNENFEYTGQIFDSNGNLVSIVSGEETYDCIKFRTIINISL